MWGSQVCVKVWGAGCDFGECDYLEILQKLQHEHTHRRYEDEKMEIKDRYGDIQWDLVGMRVRADVLPRQ